MPGAPFLMVEPSYQGAQAEGVPSDAYGSGGTDHTMFLVWLVLIGVVVPVVILGGLRVGGFQFVYKRR